MAKPPRIPTLRETDLSIKDGPVDGAAMRDAFRRYFALVNGSNEATNKSLSKGLTVGDNLRCDTVTVKATHGVAFPVRLQTLKQAQSCLVVASDTGIPAFASVQMLQPSQTGGVPACNVTVWFNSTTTVANVRLWLFDDGLQATAAPTFSPLMLSTGSITPAGVAATSGSDQTFTVAGILTTDRLSAITPPSTLGNLAVQGYPSAANTLLLHFLNPTAGPLTPPAGAYLFAAFR